MSPESLALQTDFYQLTMAAVYHANGENGPATFSLFVHNLPKARGFMAAAGLEQALDYLEGLSFSREDVDYLASLGRFSPDFLHMLAGLRFSGEVWAMPEGTAAFAGEPLLEVTAPLIQAQLVETYLINVLNLHTTLASKAARVALAGPGRALADFGLRRSQGAEIAGLAAARAAAIAGFAGTSNVAASRLLGTTPVGTMAHAFVEALGDEEAAFNAFADTFPDHTVLLIDTYNTMAGLEIAIATAQRLAQKGRRLLGVRLDSGDLVEMSRAVRARLDQAGLSEVKVVASGNLDEYVMEDALSRGAAIDLFGVGTKMVSSADHPYLNFAYKLVSYQGRPTLKLSEGKVTWVGPKQVWRRYGQNGLIDHDLLGLRTEQHEGRKLLKQVMADGRRLAPSPNWREARDRLAQEIKTLPAPARAIKNPRPLLPRASRELKKLQEATKGETLKRQARANGHHK